MTPNLPDTLRGALMGIQDADFLKTVRHRDQQWRADRKGADPEILLFERMLVRRMAKLNVPMFSSEVMRDRTRQKILFQAGRSKLTEGPHMVGCAVDIVHGTRAWDIPRKAWDIIGHVGKEIIAQEGLNLRWGGDWKFYDPAHWERIGWKDFQIPFD